MAGYDNAGGVVPGYDAAGKDTAGNDEAGVEVVLVEALEEVSLKRG